MIGRTTATGSMPRLRDPTAPAIAGAADRLRAGGVVAFPTETVYGLGAATRDAAAIERVYALKGRPADNPLIAHVTDAAMARTVVADWTDTAQALADAFWPGPLTLVMPRAGHIPAAAAGGRDTIAVRAPRHDVAQALIGAFGDAVSAPSANRSGHVSPTTAAHVMEEFANADDLVVLDGGPCAVGIESTVLALTHAPPRVLRPGSVDADALAGVIGAVEMVEADGQVESPGTSTRHYAPETPTRILGPDALRDALAHMEPCVVIARMVAVPEPHRVFTLPADVDGYARGLYAVLRAADALEMPAIVVEALPEAAEWTAVRDRLRRASHRT